MAYSNPPPVRTVVRFDVWEQGVGGPATQFWLPVKLTAASAATVNCAVLPWQTVAFCGCVVIVNDGRPVVLNFIFTRCPIANMCPAATFRMMDLQKAAKTAVKKKGGKKR